ncbi:MAG: hypothetical protein EBZ48_13265 [Proteobacteria bacterium]|nr:hypothetical protein [Pseudomonadota bacterium]
MRVSTPILFFSLVAALALACVNPIYTDEIAYEYILGRYFRDDGAQLFMWPECPTSFHTRVPWLWRAPRMVIAAAYYILPTLASLRLLGLTIAILNVSLLYRILSQRFSGDQHKSVMLLVSSLFVGTLPFLIVLARPEGLVILIPNY